MDEVQLLVLAMATLLILVSALVDSKVRQAPVAAPVRVVSAFLRRQRRR